LKKGYGHMNECQLFNDQRRIFLFFITPSLATSQMTGKYAKLVEVCLLVWYAV